MAARLDQVDAHHPVAQGLAPGTIIIIIIIIIIITTTTIIITIIMLVLILILTLIITRTLIPNTTHKTNVLLVCIQGLAPDARGRAGRRS